MLPCVRGMLTEKGVMTFLILVFTPFIQIFFFHELLLHTILTYVSHFNA